MDLRATIKGEFYSAPPTLFKIYGYGSTNKRFFYQEVPTVQNVGTPAHKTPVTFEIPIDLGAISP
jgi:hypothetical protein